MKPHKIWTVVKPLENGGKSINFCFAQESLSKCHDAYSQYDVEDKM